MRDRHCVKKMSVIVLLQPMDCQRAVHVHRGSDQVLEEAENGLGLINHHAFIHHANHHPLNEGQSKTTREGLTKGGEWKLYRQLSWTHNRALS